MKAVFVIRAPSEFSDSWFQRRKKPNLTGLVTSLEKLDADEILIISQNALKDRVNEWFERERGCFRAPVTFRFHDRFTDSVAMDPLMGFVRQEGFEDSALLVFPSNNIPHDLCAFKKTLHLHPYSPVVGVRKPGCDVAAGVISLGERNRITHFSPTGECQENEWKSVGAYYFPERFLSDGIPAFVKFASKSVPVFESFVSWSVRNFKVYAHVFAAHSGL